MFAGMVRLDKRGRDAGRPGIRSGGPVAVPLGPGSRKRIPRRPGYMRPGLLQQPRSAVEGEGRSLSLSNEETRCTVIDSCNVAVQSSTLKLICPPPVEVSGHCPCPDNGSLFSTLPEESHLLKICKSTPGDVPDPRPRPNPHSPEALTDTQYWSRRERFNSSFSFIRLSLGTSQEMDARLAPIGQAESRNIPLAQSGSVVDISGHSLSLSGSEPLTPEAQRSQTQLYSRELWDGAPVLPFNGTECQASPTQSCTNARDFLAESDACSVDAEASSSVSADSSESTSVSSVTSGYESVTPCADRSWEVLAKKYEGVLQECLQGNCTNVKIESMMLKLQGLQQKAVLEDDYDAAEHFGRKLDELQQERSSLMLGLPSKHPIVSSFLERLRVAVWRALRETAGGSREGPPSPGKQGDLSANRDGAHRVLLRRDRLLKDKQLIQEEMRELRRRLTELRQKSAWLERDLLREEEQLLQAEEDEGPALRHCSSAQLCELSRALEDTVASEHRMRICTRRPLAMLRLQERERALNTSIKEATAKVVMSQRLGSSLRRKVSESETQLLALHEAKMAAISGGDFSSAKEAKAEMKSLYGERDQLEALEKRLRALSAKSSRELAGMKEELGLVKRELEEREASFERSLRKDTLKYVELLEDRLHSCGNPAVERIWEADLEACHLLLGSLQLRVPDVSGPDAEEEAPEPVPRPEAPSHDRYEPDCAMLTALGGRWCSDADLQHSEFAKKLEEFLFCMEDNQSEDLCGDTTDVMEQCESISLRLQSLEERLQTALLTQDQPLAQSLQEEVQEVKRTLQAMLERLKHDDDGEEPAREMKGGEEEEDLYFSDSWEI